MKMLLKLIFALFALSIISSLIPSPFTAWSQNVAYESCAELRTDWPTGLARSSTAITKNIPQDFAPPRVSTSSYQLNRHLDRNDDGVMCPNKTSTAQQFAQGLQDAMWRP